MKPRAWWRALQRRLVRHAAPSTTARIDIQLLDREPGSSDWALLQSTLDEIGPQLGVSLRLQRDSGELVMHDASTRGVGRGRPAVRIPVLQGEHEPTLDADVQRVRLREALHRQLAALEPVRRRQRSAGGAGPTSVELAPARPAAYPSAAAMERHLRDRLMRDQLQILRDVVHGLHEPRTPPLYASYGQGAHLHFQFHARLVWIDARAQHHLRVRRELPAPMPDAAPGLDAMLRELDETVWDLGLAGGALPLLGAPVDWWHTPLKLQTNAEYVRYTRLPAHLDMARRLQLRPSTPQELRQQARVTTLELRRFLQASLALGLISWARAPAPRWSEAESGSVDSSWLGEHGPAERCAG